MREAASLGVDIAILHGTRSCAKSQHVVDCPDLIAPSALKKRLSIYDYSSIVDRTVDSGGDERERAWNRYTYALFCVSFVLVFLKVIQEQSPSIIIPAGIGQVCTSSLLLLPS